jgi:hypothetical protein
VENWLVFGVISGGWGHLRPWFKSEIRQWNSLLNTYNAYLFRVRLLQAGFTPVPCRDGRPVCCGSTTESGIRGWANLYPEALETGISQGNRLVIVTEVPHHRQTKAAERGALRGEACQERARRRTHPKNREYKAAKRRAEGATLRSAWMAANSISRTKPWEA